MVGIGLASPSAHERQSWRFAPVAPDGGNGKGTNPCRACISRAGWKGLDLGGLWLAVALGVAAKEISAIAIPSPWAPLPERERVGLYTTALAFLAAVAPAQESRLYPFLLQRQ